jgi:predicted nucleotidyltransferase
MSVSEILTILRDSRKEVHERYRLVIQGIFGSYVRSENTQTSDLDVLVLFDERANLLHLVGAANFLEERLGIPVDIVPADSLRVELRDQILAEALFL